MLTIFDARDLSVPRLFISILGHAVQIRAIATTLDEANAHLAATPHHAVISVSGELVFIADYADRGKAVKL